MKIIMISLIVTLLQLESVFEDFKMDWKSITYIKGDNRDDYVNIGVWSNNRNLINKLHRIVKAELEKDEWKKDYEQKG